MLFSCVMSMHGHVVTTVHNVVVCVLGWEGGGDHLVMLRPWTDCGRVLPQHQTECHDPLAAVRKDRGEKIVRALLFAVFPMALLMHVPSV